MGLNSFFGRLSNDVTPNEDLESVRSFASLFFLLCLVLCLVAAY